MFRNETNYVLTNGVLLDGSADMQPQRGMVLRTDGENILDIFQTYRNADQSAVNACRFQLFFGQLAVGG